MSLRIATFNLESLAPVSRDGVPLSERARIMRPQLERLAADILCFQEVNGQIVPESQGRETVALHELLQGTRYADYHQVCSHGPKGTGIADVHNLVTVSRLPVTSTCELRNKLVPAFQWQDLTADPPAAGPHSIALDRPILRLTVELENGKMLHVFNIHFRAPLATAVRGQKESAFVWKSARGWAEGYFLSAMKRSAQALELRLAIDDILDADPEARIAVCGDFNAEDHETPLKIIVAGEEDTGSGLLASRAMVILDRAIPEDRRHSVLHHGRPQMLDHIVTSRSLLACFQSIEVHNETLSDELVSFTRVQHPTGSHHAPVVATFAMLDV